MRSVACTEGPRLALAAGVVAMVVLAGCNVVRPGRTPEATFEAAKRAILEENYAGLWTLMASRARDAEASRIRAQQRQIAADLGNMTPAAKRRFFDENGISPDEFVNLPPAEAFAAQVRNSARVAAGLREALLDSSLAAVRFEGEHATVEVDIPGETMAELALVREHGLWKIPSRSEFFSSLRLSGRLRAAGNTPQATYEALMACVSGKAFEQVWDLFATDYQARLAETFKLSIDEVKKLDDDQRRRFERTYGVLASDYVAMGPRELLALNLKVQYREPAQVEAVLSRTIEHVSVTGETALMTLSGAEGKSKIRFRRQGEKWYLVEF